MKRGSWTMTRTQTKSKVSSSGPRPPMDPRPALRLDLRFHIINIIGKGNLSSGVRV